MIKWIGIGVVVLGLALYFGGALELNNNDGTIDISIDKDKAQSLGEDVKDRLSD